MSLYEIPTERWQIDDINADRRDILAALESGCVLFFPALPFAVDSTEQKIFTPSILGGAKNASFDPCTQVLGLISRSRFREHLDRIDARRTPRRRDTRQ